MIGRHLLLRLVGLEDLPDHDLFLLVGCVVGAGGRGNRSAPRLLAFARGLGALGLAALAGVGGDVAEARIPQERLLRGDDFLPLVMRGAGAIVAAGVIAEGAFAAIEVLEGLEAGERVITSSYELFRDIDRIDLN